jgi:methyl-accepting chemotaxis protein
MSFARPAAKTATPDVDINRLREDIDKFSKLDALDPGINRTVVELRKRVKQLEASGPQVRDQVIELTRKIDNAAAAHERRVQEAQPPSGPGDLPPDADQAQRQLEQEQSEHLEFLQRQTQEIAESSTVLNKLTHEVFDVIDRDHEKIQHSDVAVEEAKVAMEKGNAQLAEAEDHQKKTCVVA